MKIKQCPFCGGTAKLVETTECGGHGEFYRTARVMCRECGASTKYVIIDGFYGATTSKSDAIAAWNTRVSGG